MIWLQFAACTAIIFFAGANLSKYGDVIAEKTGLGRLWIGVILLASITSLPELVTGLTAVTVFDVPNIAAGDVLGSCMFNLLIIALMDAFGGRVPLSTRAHQSQVLAAAFGIVLLGMVSLSIVVGERMPALGWIGVYSFAFIAFYLAAMRIILAHERKRLAAFIEQMAETVQYQHITSAKAYALFAIHAVLIVGAASYLPYLGEQIAEMTGLGQTFVGTIFIATSTSLPEIAVSIAALRLGAVDMAVANLFGSNLFNIAILALDDIAYLGGPLLTHVSEQHLVSAIAAMIMTAIAVAGLTYRAPKKILYTGWDSLGMLLTYIFASFILYLMR